jgi:hypothetical protein
MKARTITRTFSALALVLAVAAVAATSAAAGPKKIAIPAALSHIQHPGMVSAGSTQTATVPADLARIQHPGGVSDFDTYDFVQPTGVYDIGIREPQSAGSGAGFAWGAASVGGALVLGLVLVMSGAAMTVRRRRLAHA